MKTFCRPTQRLLKLLCCNGTNRKTQDKKGLGVAHKCLGCRGKKSGALGGGCGARASRPHLSRLTRKSGSRRLRTGRPGDGALGVPPAALLNAQSLRDDWAAKKRVPLPES